MLKLATGYTLTVANLKLKLATGYTLSVADLLLHLDTGYTLSVEDLMLQLDSVYTLSVEDLMLQLATRLRYVSSIYCSPSRQALSLQIVQCAYWEHGCREEIERILTDVHEREFMHVHFKLSMSASSEMKQTR